MGSNPTAPTIASEADGRTAAPGAARRALVAGCVGNLVEWYDFALFGAFATTIAARFFPGADPQRSLVAVFGVFGVAFLARPAGAVLFGHLGDRVGRRRALTVSIVLMAVATAGIGLLPDHAAIGWPAPLLLVVLRACQGISVGGEFGGSAALVVEHAPAGHRGRYGGWQWATIGLGFALGIGTSAVLTAALPAEDLAEWGWRLPFLAALPLGLVGLVVRLRVEETPSFRALQQAGEVAGGPVGEALRSSRAAVATGFVVVAAVVATFNLYYVFLPGHLATREDVPLAAALGAALVGLMLGSASAPAFGRWSDRVGRRPVVVGGLAVLLVGIVPASALIERGSAAMLLGYVLIGLPLGALALTSFLAELFPARVRYSGLSLTYGVSSALFGGTVPLVAAAVVEGTGDVGPALWGATALTAVALVAAWRTPERAHEPLDL